jgi:hypothetical protein
MPGVSTAHRERACGIAPLADIMPNTLFVLAQLLIFFGAVSANAAQASFAWDAVSSPSVAGYRIYYGVTSRNYSIHVDVGNVTNTTILGLQDGVVYYFAATAYDVSGNESGYSNEISYPQASDYFNVIQKMYIGYYGRPADPQGLIYWAGILSESGANLTEVIKSFANSYESQMLYGTINSSSISEVVNSIYRSLFGRDADAGGLAWYVNGYNSGKYTAATVMLDILNGAQNEDLQSVNNKVAAAGLFTKTIDPELGGSNLQATYVGEGDAIAARDFLLSVSSAPETVPTQDQTTAYIRGYIADNGDSIL